MDIKDKLVYISGPYTSLLPNGGFNLDGVFENVMTARRWSRTYFLKGALVVCPHLNTMFLDGTIDFERFMDTDLELIRRCDILVMIPGWENSKGASREHALAIELGKPIIYEQL